jgi:hypothetical protein
MFPERNAMVINLKPLLTYFVVLLFDLLQCKTSINDIVRRD